MTCVPSDPRFRLLDHRVGWDAEHHDGLTGLVDPWGVRLEGGSHGLSADVLDPFVPPPALAPGCGRCEWYLAARPAPMSRIKTLDACSNEWRPLWGHGCVPVELHRTVAVAVDRLRIAVADAGTGRVWIMLLEGAQIIAEVEVDRPRDVSLGPSGDIVVVAEAGSALLRFASNGRPLGRWPAARLRAPIARIAHDPAGRLWIAAEVGPGHFALVSQRTRSDPSLVSRDAEDLLGAFERRTAAMRSDQSGFCLRRGDGDGATANRCWDWFGRSIVAERVADAAGAAYVARGQLLTRALDSAIPRCRWHRLILDADIPPGTRVGVAVATSEIPTPAPQGVAEADWAGFSAGRPHPDDWRTIAPGQSETLIPCPPGRYLFLRLRLSGDGSATPRVRRIHIDFPRATSADLLPALYREEGAAGDFTERFLSLFDASLGTVDAAVARFPALTDGASAHEEVLPWIARFLSVTLDETWDADTRRRIIRAAPDLFRRRGTRAGLARSIRLAYGLSEDEEPVIIEHGLERAWGAIAASGSPGPADARLGRTRLFSRKSARLTMNASPLGRTPVMSYGDPAADPHAAGAFRFTVGLPTSAGADEAALSRLVEGQKPAHTLAALRGGVASGFRLGGQLRLGIDTLITHPKPYVLGESRSSLGRDAVLGGETTTRAVLGLSALSDARHTDVSLSRPERET